jgi:two-component sensor histidine kinase
MPQGQEPLRRRSLGMTLIQGFSRQIGGELTFSGPPGLRLCLVFTEPQLARAEEVAPAREMAH